MQGVIHFFSSIRAKVSTVLKASCLSSLFLLVAVSTALAPEVQADHVDPIPCLTVEVPDPETGWTMCHENRLFVTQSEAYTACVDKVALFHDNVGCFQQAGGYYLAFTLTDRDDTRIPIIRRFVLRYYYAQFCQEPAVLNAAATGTGDACMVSCPVDRPFNIHIRACAPEEAAAENEECETCNPINFSTGDKYLRETDYTGSGAFPLMLTRYYHSQRGRAYDGRQEWIYGAGVAPAMIVHYEAKVLFTAQRKYSPRTRVADPTLFMDIPDPVTYRGSVGSKWGHTYDRYLLASFGYLSPNYAESPPVIRLYRPEGTVEHYRYYGGAYVAANGHTSRITSLPGGHALAPGWQVVNEDNEIEIYDMDGRLLRITNSAGLSHHLSYDIATQSKLVRVQDDFGQALEFEYENPGVPGYPERPTLMRDPEGNEYRYTYTGNGQVTRITYPDQTPSNPNDNPFRTYHYENSSFPDALTGITDENGERHTNYGYDASGKAIFSELANGAERMDVAYNLVNRTRTLTNALGRQTTYSLNSSGMILNVAGSASASGLVDAANRTNVYNSAGFVTRRIDWRGSVTNYVRDARGLETSRTEAFGTSAQRTITTSWHATLRLPTQVVEPGRTTTMAYNSLGQLLTLTETDTTVRSFPYSTNGQSRTTTFTYYPEGVNGALQLSSVDGPRTDVNDITTYEYTTEGFLSRVTNALGHQVDVIAHNARGLPLTTVDENGVVSEFTYHPRGWLLTTTVKHPTQAGLDAVTSYQYDDAGQVTRITLPNGSFLSYDYDAAHRLTGIVNNLGESITYVLDAAGNITQEQTRNAIAQITQLQTRLFDELSRLHESIGGATQLTRFDYDRNGNLVEAVGDPAGLSQVTNQSFDGLNRLAEITDAMNGLSEYGYDRRDNLTSVTDERGLTTGYIYDGFDNLLMLDSPDTGITIYSYDQAGNVASEVDARGVVKQFAYDALNRVTLEHYPDDPGEDIVYHYDQIAGAFGTGRLTSMQDQTGSTSYVYDHRGNQVEVNTTIQSASYTTQFEYDLADNLTRTTYPSGRVIDHQLDALGRVNAVTTRTDVNAAPVPVVSNVEYLPFGPPDAMEHGNELATDLTYDQDYRLTGIATTDVSGSNGPDILRLDYTLNDVNNIEDIDNSVDPNRSQAFAYDLLNRLTGAGGIYGLLYYDYDAVGNRLQQRRVEGASETTEDYTYFPQSNSIASREESGTFRFYQYDANGNVRSDGNALYFYDQQNRLIEVAE